MTTYYPRQSSSFGAILMTLIIAAIVIVGVLWFIGHNRHETANSDMFPSAPVRTSDGTPVTIDKDDVNRAGTTASSALSKAATAASTAVSETSADIKAAVNKQKQQEAAESRAS